MAKKKLPKKPRPKRDKFLAAFAICGTVTKAAEVAGIDRGSHGYWLEHDDANQSYRKAFEAAGQEAADRLEEEARRRAHDGDRKLKFHQGQVIQIPALGPNGEQLYDDRGEPKMVPYTEVERSDTLLIFLLNGARPQKFKRNVDITSGGKSVKAYMDVDDGD